MSDTPSPPRPASTVILVRNAPGGIETFMVQRHRRSGFLPNAWVFPGGRVDDTDRLTGHPRVRGRLSLAGLSESGALAYGVAAFRETFEEAGLWLGTGTLDPKRRVALSEGAMRLPELLDESGATIELSRLRPWSWWITPAAEPKRFDTRFLIAIAPPDLSDAAHDDVETVGSCWVDPRQVLDQDLEQFPLAPPTWWTLRELVACKTAEDAFALAAQGPSLPILPSMLFEEQSFRLLLPGHPDHGAPPIEGMPDQITYERSAGHSRWVAWSGAERL